MNVADHLYYVYNKNMSELVSLDAQNKDSRDFCHWIRALSLISQFKGWERYEQKYVDWIMGKEIRTGCGNFRRSSIVSRCQIRGKVKTERSTAQFLF
jgi:hypothetical protein